MMKLRWLPGRIQRWRLERAILTGRWTQAEVDDINHCAHEECLELRKHFE
jgi:hypothetical protein